MPSARKTVRVPASSANLGPGFDALALALNLYLECRFQRAESLAIHASGRDVGSISTGDDNFIWQTALRVAADIGATQRRKARTRLGTKFVRRTPARMTIR